MTTMHKFSFATALLAASTIIGLCDRATLDPTKTHLALTLSAPPVIDGKIELEEWKLAGGSATTAGGAARQDFWRVSPSTAAGDGIRGGNFGDGAENPPASAADLSFNIFAGYDADNLYIAVRVTDDLLQEDSAAAESANGTTWLDDSVEVFIDGDNSNFRNRDTTGNNPDVVGTGGQFVITVNNAYREAEAGNPGYGPTMAWYARTGRRTENDNVVGYDAEFRISLKALGNPKPGDVIGFTVGVNDDDDGGGGERQLLWVGKPHTESTYGNLMLGGRSYTAPKSAAPTVDGIVHAGEYAGAPAIHVEPSIGIFELGSPMDDGWPETDLQYMAWVTHDAEAVYVAVVVVDDNVVSDTALPDSENGVTWEDDSVEIYFDPDHSKDFGRGTAVGEGQYVFTAAGAYRHAEANGPTFGPDGDWTAVTTRTFDGYQVEFKVKKTVLGNPPDSKLMGFFLDVNDDDGSGRKSQLGWSGASHSEFTYGTLQLAGDSTGPLRIERIALAGNDLQITISSGKPVDAHRLQGTSSLAAPIQWSDVAGVSFTEAGAGRVMAKLPQPSNAPRFYRVGAQ